MPNRFRFPTNEREQKLLSIKALVCDWSLSMVVIALENFIKEEHWNVICLARKQIYYWNTNRMEVIEFSKNNFYWGIAHG